MLGSSAASGALARIDAGWCSEVKFDGWRGSARLDARGLRIRSRTGRDLTAGLPELADLPPGLLGRHIVLDGELITGAGTSDDCYGLGPRMARRDGTVGGVPVTFVAFDVLWLDGVDLCARPYLERRAALEELRVTGGGWQTSEVFDCPPQELLELCVQRGLEGVVAKRAASRYLPGRRSSDWVKLKTPQWRREHSGRRRPAA
jgi:bifunctional non-homologous end joining protein LigD